MTSPAQLVAPQLSILDLRHFAAASLRPVLEAESRVWAERLDWDYSASIQLLLQYLDARVLPGFVALLDKRVVGYTFCVYEDRKAVIGDVFGLPDREVAPEGLTQSDVEASLLRQLFSLLQHSPGVERIESQLLLHPHNAHAPLFHEHGFAVHERLFMDLPLDGFPAEQASAGQKEDLAARGLELRTWRETDFQVAGSLIANAYEGHLDSTINDQYRSVAGSLRFLHNIIRFPGCGVFDPQSSHVLADRSTGALVGLVLCSRVREDVQHITQLCVAARARNSGLGTTLLQVAARALAERGFSRLSLTVTAGNKRAAALYSRVGFPQRHSFHAMVWLAAKPGEKTPAAFSIAQSGASARKPISVANKNR